MVRWNAEGEDAAALANAILEGVVTEDLQSFKDFFDPSGPGADIAHRYNYHTTQGKRNLKLNWQKLLHKIKVWKTGKEDPETGNRKYPRVISN